MNVATNKITPMMAQYLKIKDRHQDALLFYRMGDFYEMFFDDAVAAAEALDIALTRRGRHLGADIPMCGVPVHAAENYLLSLIKKGFRVAVCEQLEDPAAARKRGAKAVVKRDVVRLVTPGTLTEDSLLEARRNNFLAAFVEIRGDSALAWVDVSTGAFQVARCDRAALGAELAAIGPSEIILPQQAEGDLAPLLSDAGAAVTPLAAACFDSQAAEKRLCAFFSVASLDGFGTFARPELSALGAILAYLELTQKGRMPPLRPPRRIEHNASLRMDAATRRNLEINSSLSGERRGSLLAAVDRTVTAAGARLLAQRLNTPSTEVPVVDARLDGVAFFVAESVGRDAVRGALRATPDIDRAVARLALERGGPRDLGAVRAALSGCARIHGDLAGADLPAGLGRAVEALVGFSDLADALDAALVDEPPVQARDGGFVAAGFDPALDGERQLRDDGRKLIAGLQKTYREETGITALKVKYNNVLGYFIETPSSHAKRMLAEEMAARFIHRQTTANAIRFTTTELGDLASRIANAGARALEIELGVFNDLRRKVLNESARLAAASAGLAEIDLAAGFAKLAVEDGWCRPRVEAGRAFEIESGRHPVVEAALRAAGEVPFVPNSCDLTPETADSAAIWLLTGPNMAGKSTFLRQNALIALLAQAGSFVPAARARIGVVSQLFSRVGASDDLARGRSTFMVEMVETAAILNQAGGDALVILDEIGRGTATYDGLSIAWATLEHLHEANRCRVLFATHYHELTALSSTLSGLVNATVSVREWEGDVVFLHEVHEGAADRSYGVQVARLAGLPPVVVARARTVLQSLEKGERARRGAPGALVEDLPLFSAALAAPAVGEPRNTALADAFADVNPDTLTPLEALKILYDLKALAEEDAG